MLGLINSNKTLLNHLKKENVKHIDLDKQNDHPDIDGLFVDWFSPKKYKSPDQLLKVTDFIEYYKDRAKMMIFDRHRSITEEEKDYFLKLGCSLYEPAIMTRKHFMYLPIWCQINAKDDLELKIVDKDKEYDLGWKGDDYLGYEFDIHYSVLVNGANLKTIFDCPMSKSIEAKMRVAGVSKKRFKWTDVKGSILMASNEDYNHGVLPDHFFEMVNALCLPLVPERHRFLTALLSETRLTNFYDPIYYLTNHKYISFGVSYSLYSRIERVFPEMIVNHTKDVILKELS